MHTNKYTYISSFYCLENYYYFFYTLINKTINVRKLTYMYLHTKLIVYKTPIKLMCSFGAKLWSALLKFKTLIKSFAVYLTLPHTSLMKLYYIKT